MCGESWSDTQKLILCFVGNEEPLQWLVFQEGNDLYFSGYVRLNGQAEIPLEAGDLGRWQTQWGQKGRELSSLVETSEILEKQATWWDRPNGGLLTGHLQHPILVCSSLVRASDIWGTAEPPGSDSILLPRFVMTKTVHLRNSQTNLQNSPPYLSGVDYVSDTLEFRMFLIPYFSWLILTLF